MKKQFYSCLILFSLTFSNFFAFSARAQDESLPGTSYYVTYERCGTDGPIVIKCRYSGGDPCSVSAQEPCP